jgi:GEVED domain/Secretion system C-terminal sorting domain/HYR domain
MMRINYLHLWFLVLISFQNVSAQTPCACIGKEPWREWIAKVQFANLNHASAKEGYGHFTQHTATVKRGLSYPMTLTRGFSWETDSTNAHQQGRVWIDFNQNGIFENAEGVATFNRNDTIAPILIPTSAKLGKTNLRIVLKTNGLPTTCDIFDRGEVEDYTLNIVPNSDTNRSKNSCLNRFELSNFNNASCIRNNSLVTHNFGVLQQYGQTLDAGFQLKLIDPLNRVQLYARKGVSTPQLGAKYRACDAKWVYFTAFGDNVLNDSAATNKEYSDVYLRVRPFGDAQDLDSVYVELDSTTLRSELKYLMPRVWGTVRKSQKCNPCFAKTPVSNCPKTEIVNFKTTTQLEQVNGTAVAQQLNLGFKDNCGDVIDFESTKYTLPNSFIAKWDSMVPFKIVQIDTAGNKTICAIKLRIVPNCVTTELYPVFRKVPKDTVVRAAIGKTCVAINLTPPTAQSFIKTITFNNLPKNYCFPIGVTPVTYTVRDSCGHAIIHKFRVTVLKSVDTTNRSKSMDYDKNVRLDSEPSVDLFPNPAQREVFIDLKAFENQSVEISISDAAGKVFFHETIEKASSAPHRLDISAMENGAYLVHIQFVGGNSVVRQLHILR